MVQVVFSAEEMGLPRRRRQAKAGGGTPLPIPWNNYLAERAPTGGRNRKGAGGKPGNRNAHRHGLYGAEHRVHQQEVRALIRKTKALIVRIEMVVRARRTFLAKLARQERGRG